MTILKYTVFSVALALSSTVAHADDLVFSLKNGTGSVLNNFHASPTGVNNWEDDVFGDQILNPGETIEITIADGRSVCTYDMKFEFQGSDLDTTTDTQDLCALGHYTITE